MDENRAVVIIELFPVRPCPLCGKPMQGKMEAHKQCIEEYNEYWDEREDEYRYRASVQRYGSLKLVKGGTA